MLSHRSVAERYMSSQSVKETIFFKRRMVGMIISDCSLPNSPDSFMSENVFRDIIPVKSLSHSTTCWIISGTLDPIMIVCGISLFWRYKLKNVIKSLSIYSEISS